MRIKLIHAEEKVLQKIGWEVRNIIMGKRKFKENDENVAIRSSG